MKIAAPLIVLSVAMLVYCNTLFGEFVIDDHEMIENNRVLLSGQSPLVFMSLDHFNVGSLMSRDIGQYRPVQSMSFWLDAALWGIQPAAFHRTNVMWHALTCLAFYWLGLLWFRDGPLALLSALCFACHPVLTEAVAYVANRHVIGSGFFVCTSLGAYTQAIGGKHAVRWSAACAVLLLLGLLCKETCMVVPVAMLGWLNYSAAAGHRWRKLVLWTAAGSATVIMVYLLLRLGIAHIPWPNCNRFAYQDSRLVTAGRAFAAYLQLLTWPVHLSLFHNEALQVRSPFTPLALVAAGLYVGLLLWTTRRHTLEGFCLLWMLLFLLPSLDRTRACQPLSERQLYIPCMGFCWLLARGILALRWRNTQTLMLCGLILCCFTWRTVHRNLDWVAEENIWTAESQTARRSLDINSCLAEVYLRRHNYKDAAALYTSLKDEHAESWEGYIGLSEVLMIQKKPLQALVVLRQAVARNARPACAIHYSLARVLLDLGRPQEAVGEFSQAWQECPTVMSAYGLGMTLAQMQRYSEAAVALQHALAINPHETDVRNDLCAVCLQGGQFYEGTGKFRLAITLYESYLEYCMIGPAGRAEVQQRLARLHHSLP